MITLGVSGHRRIEEVKAGDLERFARLFLENVGADHVITGMALGWDTAVAFACVDLRIPFTAAVPFPNQPEKWRRPDRQNWISLVNKAHRVHVCRPEYSKEAYNDRNRWIVSNCDEMGILLEPARQMSGTGHADLWARKKKRRIHPLWDRWKSFQQDQENHNA